MQVKANHVAMNGQFRARKYMVRSGTEKLPFERGRLWKSLAPVSIISRIACNALILEVMKVVNVGTLHVPYRRFLQLLPCQHNSKLGLVAANSTLQQDT